MKIITKTLERDDHGVAVGSRELVYEQTDILRMAAERGERLALQALREARYYDAQGDEDRMLDALDASRGWALLTGVARGEIAGVVNVDRDGTATGCEVHGPYESLTVRLIEPGS